MPPVFRFAPSPNGPLHLGHARSALLNARAARRSRGRLLLRHEDIDTIRCTPALIEGVERDLARLGLAFERPARRQSEHFPAYRAALGWLVDEGLVYPSFLSRGEIRAHVRAMEEESGTLWRADPDGTPLAPTFERAMPAARREMLIAAGIAHVWRLDMDKAIERAGPLSIRSAATPEGQGVALVPARPQDWGDVVLARRETPTSYHLSVVVDDASQGVSHVVRGADLEAATSVHRLLQALLGLPDPVYHHHALLLGPDGRKLSKSTGAAALSRLFESGLDARAVAALAGVGPEPGEAPFP